MVGISSKSINGSENTFDILAKLNSTKKLSVNNFELYYNISKFTTILFCNVFINPGAQILNPLNRSYIKAQTLLTQIVTATQIWCQKYVLC